MLQLDIGDLDAPGVGLRIEDLAEILVEPFALGKQLVPSTAMEVGASAVCSTVGVSSVVERVGGATEVV